MGPPSESPIELRRRVAEITGAKLTSQQCARCAWSPDDPDAVPATGGQCPKCGCPTFEPCLPPTVEPVAEAVPE